MSNNKRRIANRLRKYRIERGLEQREVAFLLSIKSHSSVSQWERGINLPSLEKLFLLSFIYKTLPDELFYDLRHRLLTQYKKRLVEFEKIKRESG